MSRSEMKRKKEKDTILCSALCRFLGLQVLLWKLDRYCYELKSLRCMLSFDFEIINESADIKGAFR
jgi:hypothetical protein